MKARPPLDPTDVASAVNLIQDYAEAYNVELYNATRATVNEIFKLMMANKIALRLADVENLILVIAQHNRHKVQPPKWEERIRACLKKRKARRLETLRWFERADILTFSASPGAVNVVIQ